MFCYLVSINNDVDAGVLEMSPVTSQEAVFY